MLNKKGILDRLYYEFVGLMFAAIVFISIVSFVSGVQEGTKLQTDFYSRDVANVITAIQAIPIENYFEYDYIFDESARVSIDEKKQSVSIGLKNSESSYFFTKTPKKQILVDCVKKDVSVIKLLKNSNSNNILIRC